jgi:PAS domain S-box-containing protein
MNPDADTKKSKTILVVEDEASSAVMLQAMLTKAGYTILAKVETGEEAVVKAAELRPDLVLMDIELGGKIDGIDAAYQIWNLYGIPFVYLTAGTTDEDFNRAKETMPFGYILKPYSLNLLSAVIDLAIFKFNTEWKLKETEKRNANILSSIPDKLVNLNIDGSFTTPEDEKLAAGYKSTGYLNDEVLEKIKPLAAEAVTTSQIQYYEYSIKKDSAVKFFEARILSVGAGNVLVLLRDITEKKNAELELENYKAHLEELVDQRALEIYKVVNDLKEEVKKSEKFQLDIKMFKHAIDQSPNLVVIVNKAGDIEYVNSKYCEITGYNAGEFIGGNLNKPANKIMPEPDMWSKIIKMNNWQGELYGLTKSGDIFYINSKMSSIKENNTILYYILLSEDITQKKKEQLLLEKTKEVIESTDIELQDKDLDWQEWKERMMSRNVSRTDKSLFRNIYNSFTQGAGFGSLLTLIDMMKSVNEKQNGKNLVDSSLFNMIATNAETAQDAFKTFSNIDFIISNEFALEKLTFSDFYDFVKAVIYKVNEFVKLKDQKIIISDLNSYYKKAFVNINKDFFYKALYEGLINAVKFSKNKTYIILIVSIINRNAVITILSEPEKGSEGILGIPPEYEKIVFEPFYRLSKLVYEQFKTLDFGLGLTLIEKIIIKHGGDVVLKNIIDHSDIKREPLFKVSLTITLPIA